MDNELFKELVKPCVALRDANSKGDEQDKKFANGWLRVKRLQLNWSGFSVETVNEDIKKVFEAMGEKKTPVL